MPRLSNIEPSIRWDVMIPESVSNKVHLLLMDPLYDRVPYGEKSKLITQLLQQWINTQIKEQTDDRLSPPDLGSSDQTSSY